jgi:hypothetical protein
MDMIEYVPVVLAAIVVGIRIAMHTPRARQGKSDHEL